MCKFSIHKVNKIWIEIKRNSSSFIFRNCVSYFYQRFASGIKFILMNRGVYFMISMDFLELQLATCNLI